MNKLLSLEFFLITFISLAIFFLGYAFRTMTLKRKSISILDGGHPTTKEEQKIRDFVKDVESRLNVLEKNKVDLEKQVKENKHMRQIKEELFLKKIEDTESKINVSMDKHGRIPQLEEIALSIDKKINNTIYDKNGLEKVRKIKDLELEIKLIEEDADTSIDSIKKEIKKLKNSLDIY